MALARMIDDGRRTARILVVDADADTRGLYGECLRPVGCDVIAAADGRDALVQALVHRPTLVITETRLQHIDGYALCEILRRDSTTRTVPIVVVTGETRETELDRAREAGADVVLIKPVSPEALLGEVQRLLRPRPPKDCASDTAAPSRHQPITRTLANGRFETTTPPATPPALNCPGCDRPLTYERSHIGGVNDRHREQWDEYSCPSSCGRFEYRQRARRLRRLR